LRRFHDPVRRFSGGRRGALVTHPGGGAGLVVTLAAHGEAAAMYGVPEAVHARSDDGPSAEDLWAGVPAREAPEAGAGAKTPGPDGLPRR
jgi:hypothetical protein